MPCPTLQVFNDVKPALPLVLAILDGVGIGRGDAFDAVAQAATPNLRRYAQLPLARQLTAHGSAVGMPSDHDMGNSEVGHNTMGAGRIFAQGAQLVQQAIRSQALFASPTWQALLQRCGSQHTTLHFIGLLSDGNVHSHIDHLLAMLQAAHRAGLQRVGVHILLDGRDVPRCSATQYVQQLEAVLAEINRHPQRAYHIASGGGRMVITMDRYAANWPMVAAGWRTHVEGRLRSAGEDSLQAPQGFDSALQAIAQLRAQQPGCGDQDLAPFVIQRDGQPQAPIRDGDAVITFNFRGDRMLQLVEAFEATQFDKFARRRVDVLLAGMTCYDGDTQRPRHFLVSAPPIDCTLSELLCAAGVHQLACSETQKYGHVTYFWNGNRSSAFDRRYEEYVEIASLPPPFDAAPAMRAPQITALVQQRLAQQRCQFARLNFANGDMVGHTGNLGATQQAVEAVDRCLGQLAATVLAQQGTLVITADHGNAEDMVERDAHGVPSFENGTPRYKTSHSLNPVPFYVVMPAAQQARWQLATLQTAGLANLAATLCHLLGFVPPAMYAPSLLVPRQQSLA